MTEEHPTIPQIVRALTTLHDRHTDEMVSQQERYAEHLAQAVPAPLPKLKDGEYFHIEYVQWNSEGEGGYYSNMVTTAPTRDEAMALLHKLVGAEEAFAIHVRRYPMPEQGVHAYDEAHQLPVAQSRAYMEGLRADKLERALSEQEAKNAELERSYDQICTGLEDTEKALTQVIEKLMDRMRRVDGQLRRDVKNCSYSEPGDLLSLMFGVGIQPDEQWERKMLTEARMDVRKKRKHREEVELSKKTGIWPLAPLVGASDTRRCACGRIWHMNEVPSWHNGLECQKPTHEEQVAEARRTTVWPIAPIKAGSNPPIRVCACGKQWLANSVPQRHNGLECQPEPCTTQFKGGPCAGEKGHTGGCSPHPKDFVPCQHEGCGHVEERHAQMLPEEGGHTFCTECGTSDYVHDFTPKEA